MNYRSAAAFRQALEDQLRNRDQAHNVGIGRLRTQVAFEQPPRQAVHDRR